MPPNIESLKTSRTHQLLIYKIQDEDLEETGYSDLENIDDYWELCPPDPSPWISAPEFNEFWSERCTTVTYTGEYVANHISEIRALGYQIGDVVQMLKVKKNILLQDVPGDAEHTWVITDKYTDENGVIHYTLSAHTGYTNNTDLAAKCSEKSGYYFRFFSFNNLNQ